MIKAIALILGMVILVGVSALALAEEYPRTLDKIIGGWSIAGSTDCFISDGVDTTPVPCPQVGDIEWCIDISCKEIRREPKRTKTKIKILPNGCMLIDPDADGLWDCEICPSPVDGAVTYSCGDGYDEEERQ